MNQVTEMLQLVPGASEKDALARLRSLFEVMAQQRGFIEAEVLRGAGDPRRLLVLHAWEQLADWQAFQVSPFKVAFSAGRPASLYEFVPCGMNWRLEASNGEPSNASFLRREVVRGEPAPELQPGAASSAVYRYEDDDPAYTGATMRLSRLSDPVEAPPAAGPTVIADEVFESVLRFVPSTAKPTAV